MGTDSTRRLPTIDAHAMREALSCGRAGCACADPKARIAHCPAHTDRRPSLVVNEQGGRLLVHCWAGCGQHEVIEALRARGLWHGTPITVGDRSPEEDARRRVLAQERYRLKRLIPWFERYRAADEARWCDQAVNHARHVATQLGDVEAAWELLEAAADLERLVLNSEGEL